MVHPFALSFIPTHWPCALLCQPRLWTAHLTVAESLVNVTGLQEDCKLFHPNSPFPRPMREGFGGHFGSSVHRESLSWARCPLFSVGTRASSTMLVHQSPLHLACKLRRSGQCFCRPVCFCETLSLSYLEGNSSSTLSIAFWTSWHLFLDLDAFEHTSVLISELKLPQYSSFYCVFPCSENNTVDFEPHKGSARVCLSLCVHLVCTVPHVCMACVQ